MRSLHLWLIAVLTAVFVVTACEPSGPPVRPTRSPKPSVSAAATTAPSAGQSAGPSGSATTAPSAGGEVPQGSPRVEIDGTTVTIVGRGDKNTSVFELDGTYTFETTACPGTGVIPFVWVYEEFGQGRGTYVDAKFTVKNLVGKFYIRIAGPPACEWKVTLTKT